MSGGITDGPSESAKKRVPYYEATAQGATAGALRDSLKDIPDEAEVVWVDSYTEELVGFGTPTTTAGIGFKWAASLGQD